MAKKNKQKNDKDFQKKPEKEKKKGPSLLDHRTKKWIRVILMFLASIIITLSFLDKAGMAGQAFVFLAKLLFGDSKITIVTIVLAMFAASLILIKASKKIKVLTKIIAVLVLTSGVSGLTSNQGLYTEKMGLIGWIAKLLVEFFGLLVSNIVFASVILIGLFIFLQFIWQERDLKAKEEEKKILAPQKPIEAPTFKIKGIEEPKPEKTNLFKKKEEKPKEKIPVVMPVVNAIKGKYSLPPVDLLSKNETPPTSGNIKENSLIIKKTLENFGIPVEMEEVNIGPAVTQYAFKPAEGVKLSKITTLSNNLALALAAHPIRIEAPIPGKSLVGIEVPNKIRAMVTLRNLVADNLYQSSPVNLIISLGKDVGGNPVYTDLSEMPHVLVAGSTGTGKTVFLNSLILSLLYKNTPETMRMIMVDPKRVEFQNYNEIPHLLCPVIYDAQKTMNALQWLAREMERRFEVFSEIPARNIKTYNQNKNVIASGSQLPYIVLVIDELADLMAAKGKELEGGIVRLAQMARATGIHLVLATQRPSVEVITGLIKANMPSRITFQVTSQVDSRTVLDTAGAEKLLGNGDMLFLSSKSSKITRIQGPYIPEKEVKKVADWIVENAKSIEEPQGLLVQSLKDTLEHQPAGEKGEGGGEMFFGDDDPLFEDVKRIVLETKKASASFLQRRLRIGYARAARLIDMLEDKGIVGPADGAKPREVYGDAVSADVTGEAPENNTDAEEPLQEGWEKV